MKSFIISIFEDIEDMSSKFATGVILILLSLLFICIAEFLDIGLVSYENTGKFSMGLLVLREELAEPDMTEVEEPKLVKTEVTRSEVSELKVPESEMKETKEEEIVYEIVQVLPVGNRDEFRLMIKTSDTTVENTPIINPTDLKYPDDFDYSDLENNLVGRYLKKQKVSTDIGMKLYKYVILD